MRLPVQSPRPTRVLELNPFEAATSACLFDWGCAKDVDILRGAAPFETRVVRAPRPGVLRLAGPHIKPALEAWVARTNAAFATC